MPDTTPETGSIHEELVREYAILQDRVATDTARMDEIKKVLRGDLSIGSHAIAGLTVQVARNARLDADRFTTEYPVLEHPQLYKSVPDPAAIKRNLAPAVIEQLQVEGEPRLTIK